MLQPLAPGDVPIDLDRQEAARQAIAELANPDYRTAQPTWLERLVGWLMDQATELAHRASAAAPGGWWGILGLAVVVATAIVLIRWRVGPVSRRAELQFAVDPGISAARYRMRAEQLAAGGQWAGAVNERMRAIVRAAEERGLATPRPGRTADELAGLIGVLAPAAGPALNDAAGVFDRVRYGGRPADANSYRMMVAADDALATAHRAAEGAPQR